MAQTTIAGVFITDNTIDGTKIALGSDAQGDVMYYNGTDWVRLGFGTDGHFLKTQGTGANPLWAAAGGGSLTLLQTQVADDSADLTLTGLASAYGSMLIVISDLRFSSNASMYMQVGTDSSLLSGSSDYDYHISSPDKNSNSYYAINSSGDSKISFGGTVVGNDTGEGFAATLWLNRPGNGNISPVFMGNTVWVDSVGTLHGGVVAARLKAVTNITRLFFWPSTGQFTSGRISIYGVAHA